MTILLLGGTGEGRLLAKQLDRMNADFISSLAGATRKPAALPGRVRHGGFGGADGFRQFVKEANIVAIVDATHPFAYRISRRSASIAKDMCLPYLQVLRPGWVPGPNDNWSFIDREEDAADFVHPNDNVFVATGRQTLARFSVISSSTIFCRQIDPPDGAFPFPKGEFVIGRPPFSVDQETELFAKLRIDWLITKNAGGENSRSKLDAARALSIPVLMIKRPPPATDIFVSSVQDATEWLRQKGLV